MKITMIFIFIIITSWLVTISFQKDINNSNTETQKKNSAINKPSERAVTINNAQQDANGDADKDEMDKTLEMYNKKRHGNKSIAQSLLSMQSTSDIEIKQKFFEKVILEIKHAQSEKQITNLEAMSIHLSALKYRYNDEEYTTKEKAIKEKYTRESQEKWDTYLENRDEEFLNYKKMESDLIVKIKNMNTYPDGLTKNAYLKSELLKLRKEAYGTKE